jgi:hypothetical protein
MTLERRGEWWYGTEAADIDAFLLQHGMGRPDYNIPHRVVHARCAGCGGTTFALVGDASDNVCRVCLAVPCPNEDAHYICGCERYFDDNTEQDFVCPCGRSELQVAVGFGHTLVRMEERAERKSGKLMPFVNWVYVAGRCVACGLIGVYADWHERGCEPPEHLYGLV